jgi:hypothetical protein
VTIIKIYPFSFTCISTNLMQRVLLFVHPLPE